MFKKPIIFTGILSSAILLSGCVNPFVVIDNHIENAFQTITTDSNSNSNPSTSSVSNSNSAVSSAANSSNQSNIINPKDINYHTLHLLVKYYDRNSKIISASFFIDHTQSLIQAIATFNQQHHLNDQPNNNLDLAILYANLNWPNFLIDYRNQPRKLLYIRLTQGTDTPQSNNDTNNNISNTIRFTPQVSKLAIHHIFKIFAQQPSKYNLKFSIDPKTGNQNKISPQLTRQLMKNYTQANLEYSSPIQKTKRRLIHAYDQARHEEQQNHVGTPAHPDNDSNRARAILNGYIVQASQTKDMSDFESPGTIAGSIHQLLTTKYHFTDQVMNSLTNNSSPISEDTLTVDAVYSNQREYQNMQ